MESDVTKPNEVEFLHTKPAITLSPSFVKQFDTRVGDVRIEYFDNELHDARIVVALAPKELDVAEYSGLLIEHPIDDTVIYFGPWVHGKNIKDTAVCCTVTKYTRPSLQSGKIIQYNCDNLDVSFELFD